MDLLGRREDAASLAICRIVVAVTVCESLADLWIRGVAAAGWVDVKHGGISALEGCWLERVGGCTETSIGVVIAIGIAASAFMAAGAFTRVSSALTWLSFRFLVGLAPELRDASDRLIVNILFVLMLSGCGRALSVDARLRGKGGDTPSWPRWVLIAQLVILYFSTVIQKVSSSWIPGGPLDAIWYIAQQPTWQKGSMRWLAPYYPITQALTLITWMFEMSSPLFAIVMWLRATRDRPGRVRAAANRYDLRSAYLAVGVCLHVAIAATLAIQQFLGAMLALYACCYRPEEWRALLRWIAARTWARAAKNRAIVGG